MMKKDFHHKAAKIQQVCSVVSGIKGTDFVLFIFSCSFVKIFQKIPSVGDSVTGICMTDYGASVDLCSTLGDDERRAGRVSRSPPPAMGFRGYYPGNF